MFESGVVDIPLEVEGEFTLAGVARRGGIVRSGGALWLSGVMHGELVVEQGAQADISGTFHGELFNSGRVLISGVFAGSVARNDGEVLARVGSVFKSASNVGVLQRDGSLAPPPRSGGSTVITTDTPVCRLVGERFEPVI